MDILSLCNYKLSGSIDLKLNPFQAAIAGRGNRH